jgi:hypothetical protein
MALILDGSAGLTFPSGNTQSNAGITTGGGSLNGPLSLGGNLSFNTSNAGITFNNSSALVNSTLNDYETGTWTPTITSLTGTITSYTASGTYVKVGKLISLMFNVSVTNAGSAGGVMIIGNLPFTTGGVNASAGSMRENAVTGISGGLVPANTTTLYGAKYDGGNPTVTGYTWACQITYLSSF